MYGAPEGVQKGVGAKMNKGFMEGTFFRGSVLLDMCVEEAKEPRKEGGDFLLFDWFQAKLIRCGFSRANLAYQAGRYARHGAVHPSVMPCVGTCRTTFADS